MKILIVEDSITSATVVLERLKIMDLYGMHVFSGEDALTAFRNEAPDLILLDIVLPGINGFDVARQIREIERDTGGWTPIIFLSSRTADEDLVLGLEVGGDDYLFKPISRIVLEAKLRAMQRIITMRDSLLDVSRRLDVANQELLRLSSVDGLTNISNRRHFDDALEREWKVARRDSNFLSLLIADVDCFKQFNDGYGHQMGDECLKAVARILNSQVRRPADIVARFGGEEFVILLPNTDLVGAQLLAQVMCMAVAERRIPHKFSDAEKFVTISVGYASINPDQHRQFGADHLIGLADRGLYQAKKDGRNRISCIIDKMQFDAQAIA